MVLSYVSCSPVDGSVDNYINPTISVTFDKAVNASTIHQGTINLIEVSSGASVPLTVSRSSTNTSVVVITTSTVLKENSAYRLVIIGEDLSLGSQVEASDGDKLSTTIYVTFSTGDSVYQIDTTTEKDAADKTLEGDLFLPTNLKALGYDFTVTSVRPKNHSWDVAQSLTGDNIIRFTFSKALYTSGVLEDWANISVYPMLDVTEYLASGSTFGSGSISIPSYGLSVTGQDLLITFSGELPKNVTVNVELTNQISAADGTEYGGNLSYSIATELFPRISGVNFIKNEIRPLASNYYDDYVASLIFKNIILTWEMTGRALDISSFSYAAKQYVICSTVLDLLEDADFSKWVKAGVRRRLGDFEVSVADLLGRVAIKQAKYEKMKHVAKESLFKGWQFKVGITSAAFEQAASDISRLWYNVNNRYTFNLYKFWQEDIPASNVTINRWAKTNNPVWW